jgi:hypothetical protein
VKAKLKDCIIVGKILKGVKKFIEIETRDLV